MERILYLAIASLADFFLSRLFPADFSVRQAIFFPACGLFALINNCRDQNVIDSVKMALFYGLFVSLFYPYTFWMHAILFSGCVLLMHLWLITLNDSAPGMILITLLLLFLYYDAMYVYLVMNRLIGFSFLYWNWRVTLCGMIGNIPCLFAMLWLDKRKRNLEQKVEESRQQGERVFLYDLFSRQSGKKS